MSDARDPAANVADAFETLLEDFDRQCGWTSAEIEDAAHVGRASQGCCNAV